MYRPLNYLEKIAIYGCLGLCVEVFFTGIASAFDGNVTLEGKTYIWMAPIWAGGLFAIEYAISLVKGYHYLVRGLVYTYICFTVEYVSGIYLLFTLGVIPWDYSPAVWSVHGAIRLDYLPFWFISGLLSEKVISFINSIEVKYV